MEMRAACWSIGSTYESLTVDETKTIKSRPSPASQVVLMNYIILSLKGLAKAGVLGNILPGMQVETD